MSRRLIPWMLFLAGVSIVAGGLGPVAAHSQKKDKAATVADVVARAGITKDSPGVALISHSPNSYAWETGFGLADLKGHGSIGLGTMFELASCSKPFTATAILILHDRGKLDINDPIRKHIPELPEWHKDRPVRIIHLLHHTGGMPNYMALENVKPKVKGSIMNEDFVPEFAHQKDKFPALFAPDDKYEYSNCGYMLLATIVQRVSGQTFGHFIRENIFAPLKMNSSFVYESQDAPQKLPIHPAQSYAVGYQKDAKKKTDDWTESWGCPPRRHEQLLAVGDGAVWTCADDMLKWDKAIRDRALLKPQTWARALTPSKTKDGKTNDYGLGWGLALNGNKLVGFGHNGAWGGFRTMYWLDIGKNRTTILLSNRGDFNPDEFQAQLDRLLDKK